MSTVQIGALTAAANSFNGPNGAISLSPAKPTGTAEGDLLIAVGWYFDGAIPTAAPSGWTEAVAQDIANPRGSGWGWGQHLWWKRATSSEPGSYNFTFSEGNTSLGLGYGAYITITAWRGAPAASPVTGTASASNSDQSTVAVTLARHGGGRVFAAAMMANFNTDHSLGGFSPAMTYLLGPNSEFNSGTPTNPGFDFEYGTVEGGADELTETVAVGTPQLNDCRMMMLAQLNDPAMLWPND